VPQIDLLFRVFWDIIQPFVAMGLIALGWMVVAELRKHGYKATYAAAIVRAMGTGVLAAQDAGVDPFSARGRRIVAETGAKYIQHTVPEAASALDLELEDHGSRVVAQLGTVAATVELGGKNGNQS
jgi:hypothetical protein